MDPFINKHENHIECSISDTDLFTPAFVQSDIESGMFEDIYPITNLDDNGPIEFLIENATDKFLDLPNSYLKAKFKVVKGDGSNLAEADKVGVINYPIATLFSQVDISLGGQIISSSTNTYGFRSYIETLLNYGKEAKGTQLSMGLFYKDTAGFHNDTVQDGNNTGLVSRHNFCKNSQTVSLLGRIHSDIFNQGRLLVNALPLKITLHRQKSQFVLMNSEAADYKIKLTDVLFGVRKVQLTPHKFQEIQQHLEKNPALYLINRVEIKTHSIAAGLTYLNWDNAILGQLPNRLFIAMVDNIAFTGNLKENPFNFKHNNLTTIAAHINGKSVPNNPITINFENDDYLEAYRSLFTATSKINRDEGLGIDRIEYKKGYTLFGFDLSPALCAGGHQEAIQNGNLRLTLEFSKRLPRSITVILYTEYDNTISVFKTRSILKNS